MLSILFFHKTVNSKVLFRLLCLMLTAPINEIIVFVVYFIAVFLDIDYQGQGLFPTDLTVRFISYQSYVLEDEIKKLGLALRIKKV